MPSRSKEKTKRKKSIEKKTNDIFRSKGNRESGKHVHELNPDLNWLSTVKSISKIDCDLSIALIESPSNSDQIKDNLRKTANLLFMLDQHLLKLSKKNRELISYFEGQFCLHAASFIFKQEEAKLQTNLEEAERIAMPLLWFAYKISCMSKDHFPFENINEETKQFFEMWRDQNNFCMIQAAYALNSYRNKNPHNNVMDEIRLVVLNSDWRITLFKQLFNAEEHLNSIFKSYFVKSSDFESLECEWPCMNSLKDSILKAIDADRSTLPYLIYLFLTIANYGNISIDSNVPCVLFEKLNFSTPDLDNCSVETLNQLDIDSFLFGTTLQTLMNCNKFSQQIFLYNNMVASGDLCTSQQIEWWSSSISAIEGNEQMSNVQLNILKNGIQTVRGLGTQKMDLSMLLKMGQYFGERAQSSLSSDERKLLIDRKKSLFKCSMHKLKNYISSSTSDPVPLLFDCYFTGIKEDVNGMAEKAVKFLAEDWIEEKKYTSLIECFDGIDLPYASYYTSVSFCKLISENPNLSVEDKNAYNCNATEHVRKTISLLKNVEIHPLQSIMKGCLDHFEICNSK